LGKKGKWGGAERNKDRQKEYLPSQKWWGGKSETTCHNHIVPPLFSSFRLMGNYYGFSKPPIILCFP
jgi:hypothetical protein